MALANEHAAALGVSLSFPTPDRAPEAPGETMPPTRIRSAQAPPASDESLMHAPPPPGAYGRRQVIGLTYRLRRFSRGPRGAALRRADRNDEPDKDEPGAKTTAASPGGQE
jgi:hypothetical protein